MACEPGEDVDKYLCLPPDQPPAAHVIAPYVELDLKGMIIKGGNESFTALPHEMAIASMQYSIGRMNSGLEAEFEILAEGSEGYKRIVKIINKTIKLAGEEINQTRFRFGWIKHKCSGSPGKELSPWIKCLPIKCSANIDKGITKIKLTCKDLLERHNDRRVDMEIGEEGNLRDLKDAITELCQTNDPPIDVEFRGADGGDLEFELGADQDGPKAVWHSNEMPLLSTIRNWLNVTRTKNKKGTYFKYDPEEVKLIIQEDEECRKGENCSCDGVIASYIVNGGNCSTVLEFNPEINWILDAGGYGGSTGGGSNPQMGKYKGAEQTKPIEKTGSGNEFPVAQELSYTVPPEAHTAATIDAAEANNIANRPSNTAKSIEAELTIIGDPSFVNLADTATRAVSIAVISPYKIEGSGAEGGCRWIAEPPLNPVLSNKRWMIQGVNHQIEGGKYVTKLKVDLPVPNAELPNNEPFGGFGTEGFAETDNAGDGTFAGED